MADVTTQDIEWLQAQIEDLKEDLSKALAAAKSAGDSAKKAGDDAVKLQADVTSLKSETKALQDRCGKLENRCSQIETDLKQLRAEYDAHIALVSETSSTICDAVTEAIAEGPDLYPLKEKWRGPRTVVRESAETSVSALGALI